MMSSPRSRITRTKRACDGCQIRKVKCDGGQPCLSCANTKIVCTFSRTVHTRGPRRMREATRNIIERRQREERQQSVIDDGNFGLDNDPAEVVSIRQESVNAYLGIIYVKSVSSSNYHYSTGRGNAPRSVRSHHNCTYTT